MTPSLQTHIAEAIVVIVLIAFVLRWLALPKKPGCGGGCGCASTKQKIRKQ